MTTENVHHYLGNEGLGEDLGEKVQLCKSKDVPRQEMSLPLKLFLLRGMGEENHCSN